MKKWKQWVSGVAATLMALMLVPMGAMAAAKPELTVNMPENIEPGQQFAASVELKNNPGWAAFTLITTYDSQYMELEDVKAGSAVEDPHSWFIYNETATGNINTSAISQMGPMLALRDQCAGGIRLAARALGTTDATVLVYRHISDSEVAIPRNIGGIPISLSTSGGALIAGLFFGWLRSKHPTFGRIPEPSQWVLNNVGLNMFIAVVGISAGPSFVQGFHDVGISLFLVGAAATTLPLIIGLLLARYVFKFHPALALGVCAGARTTTAALGAVQDAVESETPALGYTVTYAVGNTLLIIWGVVIVLLL